MIAAVYYNRLRKGMLLQADPTIQYALGRHVGRVYYKDLAIKSPYNTYINKGLPPGPIASPGVASLAAAAHPASVPYLYFVASRDGHHEFRMTLNEHVNAIRQVRATARSKKTKPLMVASAAPNASSRTATKAATKPASRSASKAPAKKTSTTRTPAKTTSKLTSKPASKTAVKSTARKSVRSTAPAKEPTTTRQIGLVR